jgi:thiol-disulfide isomerase/thioredoxin
MGSKLKYIIFFVLAGLVALFFYNKYRVAPTVDLNKLELFYADGQQVKWENFKGKKTIVSFSASWCGNCRHELKALNKIKESSFPDVEIIVISDENIETVGAWAEQLKYPFTFLKMNRTFPDIGINSIPVTYIINKNGEVKDNLVGEMELDASQIEHLKKILE